MISDPTKKFSFSFSAVMLVWMVMLACCADTRAARADSPITPWAYQAMLGCGMDVDWAKTRQGIGLYAAQAPRDFSEAGIRHVRIRVKDDADAALLDHLERIVQDCLSNHLIPVVAYQADAFKNDPSDENLEGVVMWWRQVAERFRDTSYILSFDVMIECTDELNQRPDRLNDMYEHVVASIRESNPERIVMLSPRLRSDCTS